MNLGKSFGVSTTKLLSHHGYQKCGVILSHSVHITSNSLCSGFVPAPSSELAIFHRVSFFHLIDKVTNMESKEIGVTTGDSPVEGRVDGDIIVLDGSTIDDGIRRALKSRHL
jgi:hypothetical protein